MLFDYDEDDRISGTDIINLLKILDEKTIINESKPAKQKRVQKNQFRIANVQDLLVKSVLSELVISKKNPSITLPVFNDLMMNSNIHMTCVLDFDSDDE